MSAYSPMTDFLPTLPLCVLLIGTSEPANQRLGSQVITNDYPEKVSPSSPYSQTHHNFIVNNYLFSQIVIMPNPCAGLKDFCESLSGICQRIENIQPQSISISMNEQWTNTPHIKYSYPRLGAHKYPDIENNNLPTWPGVMFCQRRNVIGNVCVVTMAGMSPAAYWLRLPSDQSELKLILGARHSLPLSLSHIYWQFQGNLWLHCLACLCLQLVSDGCKIQNTPDVTCSWSPVVSST